MKTRHPVQQCGLMFLDNNGIVAQTQTFSLTLSLQAILVSWLAAQWDIMGFVDNKNSSEVAYIYFKTRDAEVNKKMDKP